MSNPMTKEEATEVVEAFAISSNGFTGWVSERYIYMVIEGSFKEKMFGHPMNYILLIEALEEKTNSYYVEKQMINSHTSFYLLFRRHIYLETN